MSRIEPHPGRHPDETTESSELAVQHAGERAGLDRRTVLKAGAAIGAAAIVTSKKTDVFAAGAPLPPAPPQLCGTTLPTSPATRPFLDKLPVPPPALPVFLNPAPTNSANIAAGEAARADHQRWAQFPPLLHYRMDAVPSLHRHHADLLPSYLWTFNGRYPAPTPLNYYGVPSLVRFRNALPEAAQNTTFGTGEITVHLHNGHTASESDGFAGDFFGTGLFKDNHYPNAYAGIDDFGGLGDPREALRTLWFHDHRAGTTAHSNYLGLNGMYILYDMKDPSHELPVPGSLRLPCYYGLTDIPLILTEKRFCPAANGRNEAFQVVGNNAPSGDKWVVNGKIQPKMRVRRRKYRFRILNTGPVKAWDLSLIRADGSQAPMTLIAADGNFLASPVVVSDRELNVQVSMRFDVVIDFSAFPAGSSVYLKERAAQNVGVTVPDPAPGLPIENVLMRFDVIDMDAWFPADTPPIPGVLAQMPDPIVPDAAFQWNFTLESGSFRINGEEFDHNRIDHVVLKGSSEEWVLANDVAAGNWPHPIHIHLEEGFIMSRRRRISQDPDVFENVPLLPEEQGRRDVYHLPPQHRLVIRLRFRDYVGRYLIHCHNMNHEDNFMMVRWDVVDSLAELTRRRREIDERRMLAGLPPQYSHGGLV